mmetsp:Transcript_13018/g.24186  ORF Transcript_13018/g.24186 Transcript_13018/m.24186 type:complete len:84 (-) Transcript_13018:819-1070(-)
MSRAYKTLYELFSSHPSQGVGFRIWKSDWPSKSYIHVSKTELKSELPKAWGSFVWRGTKQSGEIQVNSPLKRGLWRFAEAKSD